jgi:hypothetical protein
MSGHDGELFHGIIHALRNCQLEKKKKNDSGKMPGDAAPGFAVLCGSWQLKRSTCIHPIRILATARGNTQPVSNVYGVPK